MGDRKQALLEDIKGFVLRTNKYKWFKNQKYILIAWGSKKELLGMSKRIAFKTISKCNF